MGTLSYLTMTNRILRRISQPDITDVTAATGQGLIITDLLNEAQDSLAADDNWYTLYTSRTFSFVASTATVAVAADFGKCIDLVDTTAQNVLEEDAIRILDIHDRGASSTGTPECFALIGTDYHFYPIPAAANSVRERYWKKPTAMAANGDTSSLPDFCDNLLIYHAWSTILEYLNKFSTADRIRLKFSTEYERAKSANKRLIDKMRVFRTVTGQRSLRMPRLPNNYGYGGI